MPEVRMACRPLPGAGVDSMSPALERYLALEADMLRHRAAGDADLDDAAADEMDGVWLELTAVERAGLDARMSPARRVYRF